MSQVFFSVPKSPEKCLKKNCQECGTSHWRLKSTIKKNQLAFFCNKKCYGKYQKGRLFVDKLSPESLERRKRPKRYVDYLEEGNARNPDGIQIDVMANERLRLARKTSMFA